MPDLVDLTEADALAALDDADLLPGDMTEANDETIVAGSVIAPIPPPTPRSRPAPRSTMSSPSAPSRWPCPISSTCTEADALAALDDADLLPGDMTEANDATIVAGNVISYRSRGRPEVAPGSGSPTSSPSAPSGGGARPRRPDRGRRPRRARRRRPACPVTDRGQRRDHRRGQRHQLRIPPPTTEVAPGSEVAYVVSIGPESVPCPTSSTCPRPTPSPRSTTPTCCPVT